jgi:hypothetical protein
MPPRNERQFSYLSYENLCLRNLRSYLAYTSHNQHTQVSETICGFNYGYGYGKIIW